MEAVRVKARIDEYHRLVLLEPTLLRPGEVEVIVLYQETGTASKPPGQWPVLEGGQYRGGDLRRADIYDDAR